MSELPHMAMRNYCLNGNFQMTKDSDPFDCIEEKELPENKPTKARDLSVYLTEVEKDATRYRKQVSRKTRQSLFLIFGLIIAILLLFYFFSPAGFIVVFFLLGGLLIYFVPTFIAIQNNHINAVAIAMLNVFLGWTFLGWVVALVWACMESQKKS
jgi:hypothetical protein